MAASGSFNTSAYEGRCLTFSWSIKSQDVATNKTTINWTLKSAGGDSTWYKSGNFKVMIAGVTVYSSEARIELGKGQTVASGTYTFIHNNDGSKSFTAYAEAGIFTVAVNCTGQATFALDAIPRASQPSCVTWPEHTQNVGSFGDTISIHMNRKADVFTHTVRYAFGNLKDTIATGVTTGTTWTIPLSFMDLIPNATKASGTIYVDTYQGTTLIGTKYCGFTATVPASVKPTCTITLEDVSGVGDVYGSPVQGLSRIKVKVNPKLAYSSPIVAYTVKINGATYTAAEITSGVLKAAGDSPVTVTVKDQRGRTGSASYTMKVQAYNPPSISQLTVRRCNADGTENDQGEHVQVSLKSTLSSMSGKNTAAYTLRYKTTEEDSFTEVALSDLAGVYAVNGAVYIFEADSNNSYDVEVEAADRHGATTRSTSASTAFTLLNWGADGTSMGIGKVAEKEGTLQIALDVEFIGKVTGAIFDAILPVGSMVMRYDHLNPNTLYPGTTWVRVYGAFPWFTDDKGQIGLTGGERNVTLTADQMPKHSHGGTYTNAGTARTHAWLASGGSAMGYDTVEAGGGEAHNNMPPYIQVSAWRRTA